ncbi:class I SAM-dependent methyltransferase [Candidatus Pristimantibacillus sp. PTI5]|uniref:class I SAM-dependent methyltransferase n=1 Tax=Candidatus Pristimantibacillus sp. PTI5 TaxID=3400422 RepID=UPI003B02DF00
MKQEDLLKSAWEQSYFNRDNYVFYPHEEVIRFTSKYVRKRIGLKEFLDVNSYDATPKVLDLGCGIGRHIVYFCEMKLEPYGVDLSENAVKYAIQWAKENGLSAAEERIVQGDVTQLPWQEQYFDFMVSHGVLDSMSFETARLAIKEAHRVLKKDGLFYCDLVSGDDSIHFREFNGEEIVATKHEQGTIQSYFNFEKINELIDVFFEIKEAKLISHENCISNGYYKRYHVVLQKK